MGVVIICQGPSGPRMRVSLNGTALGVGSEKALSSNTRTYDAAKAICASGFRDGDSI